MKSTVLVDRSLADQADRFVFLALDTDREVNAAAVDKLPPSAWPTFYVIGTDENVLGRFVGGASLSQFRELLAAGARASDKRSTGADAKLLEAERAIAAKQPAEAQAALTEALAQAPAEWTRRPDALVSLVGVLAKRGDAAGCLALGEKSMDQTGNTASATDFAALTLACTAKLDGEAGRIKQLRERVVVRLTKLVDDAASPLSIDDRSDALLNLRDALVALGRSDDAKQTAERQRALLDDAAAKASDARAAMTFNWPRAEVYVFLGRPLDLVPALEKSIRDLPGEYDPPARLGWLLFKAGKLDDAARMTDAALRLAYGPRKVRVLTLRADIAAAAKDANAERTYRSQIVAALEALPASQTTPEQIAKAKEALRQLTQ
jgi:tetratricopeptide (TPR) repeat protein